MKRIFTLIMLAAVLLGVACAEDSADSAKQQYDAILQREEAIQLEMQIAELEIQLAKVKNDEKALALAELQVLSLENELASLALSKEALAVENLRGIREEQQRLTREAENLQNQMSLLQAALDENAAAQKAAQEQYDTCMKQNAKKGTANGFASKVTVLVLRDATGAIHELTINTALETPFFGSRCGEDEAFRQQFIGKTGPFTIGVDVDALSGATVTSRAVVKAINSVLAEQAPAAEPDSITLSGSEKGMLSDVNVTITLLADGTITAITVDCSGETAVFAKPCSEPDFLNQFIGRTGPFVIDGNVDVVAGATVTSQAIVKAVNSLLAGQTPAAESDSKTLSGSAKGLLSDVGVTITLAADGTIAAITVDCSGETAMIAKPCSEPDFLNQFIGKSGPFVIGGNVDVVSGATFTSQAVVNAVNSLLP